jgi:hypothetical protein
MSDRSEAVQAAEKYVTLEVGTSAMLVFRSDLEKAHLAGQEVGAKRERERCIHILQETPFDLSRAYLAVLNPAEGSDE